MIKKILLIQQKIDSPICLAYTYLSGLHNGQNATMFISGKSSDYCITLLAHTNDDVSKDSSCYFQHKMPIDEI